MNYLNFWKRFKKNYAVVFSLCPGTIFLSGPKKIFLHQHFERNVDVNGRIMLRWEFELVPKRPAEGSEIKTWYAWMLAHWSTPQRSCELSREAVFKLKCLSSSGIIALTSYWLQSGGSRKAGKHSGPPFLLSETRVLQGERRASPVTYMSAAWVIQESYSQVKLWPFNGTYCKGICWSLSRDTSSFTCRGTLNVFARVAHEGGFQDPYEYVSIQRETVWTVFSFLGLSRTTEARCGGNMPKALS